MSQCRCALEVCKKLEATPQKQVAQAAFFCAPKLAGSRRHTIEKLRRDTGNTPKPVNKRSTHMALATALQTAPRPRVGSTCTVETLFAHLTAEDTTALTAALASDMQSAQIARALKAEGHHISAGIIGRHRRGDCNCGTS